MAKKLYAGEVRLFSPQRPLYKAGTCHAEPAGEWERLIVAGLVALGKLPAEGGGWVNWRLNPGGCSPEEWQAFQRILEHPDTKLEYRIGPRSGKLPGPPEANA